MKDFTISVYKNLLKLLNEHSCHFKTFGEFIEKPESKIIILRHDVDKLPQNALRFAQMEHGLGIRGSYYFRIVPQSFDPVIIEKIAVLDHEIGYHYEDIDLAYQKLKNSRLITRNSQQIFTLAIDLFEKHLDQFRKYYPIQTICMHGSPRSKWDNKDLWNKYNYKDFGIIGEPYFDIDFSNLLYLTDTGRRWNGERVSIRDKVFNRKGAKTLSEKYNFRTTFDIINAAEKGKLPEQIMLTVHPQRWSDKFGPWVKELVWQGMKNQVKRLLIRLRD